MNNREENRVEDQICNDIPEEEICNEKVTKTKMIKQEGKIVDKEATNRTKGNREVKEIEEEEIENKLINPNIKDQVALREFLKNIRFQMKEYERKYGISESNVDRMKRWQSRVFMIIKKHRDVPEEITESSREGFEILKLMDRQLQQAETNQKLLEKTTLKLIGLDYSFSDIEKAMNETKKKIELSKTAGKREKRRVFYAFVFFIMVCFYIVFDKFSIKFLKR